MERGIGREGPPSDEYGPDGNLLKDEAPEFSVKDIEVQKKPAYEGPESLENKLRFDMSTEPSKDGPYQVQRVRNEEGRPVLEYKRCPDASGLTKWGNEIHNQFDENGKLVYQKQENFDDEAAFKAERKTTGGFEKKFQYSEDWKTVIENGNNLLDDKAWENKTTMDETGRKSVIEGESTAGPELGRKWKETYTYSDGEETILSPVDGKKYTGKIMTVRNEILAQGADTSKDPERTVILKKVVLDKDGKCLTYWREKESPKE